MASSQAMASAPISSTPVGSDADENGLSHAIGVLTLRGEADATASCNDSRGEGDSGYASRNATTDNQKGKQPQEFIFQSRSLLRKSTKLRAFDSPLPASVKNRFDDLVELLGQPLSDYVSKSRGDFSPISIKLKLLGDTESRAEPWIVVMSDKSALKKIKRFFYQNSIKKQWQGEMDDPDLPRFQIYFYERPPRQNGATQHIPVYYGRDDHLKKIQTLSGNIIIADHPTGPRIATLGGMVTVIAGDGKYFLYGMTVGHIAKDENQVTQVDEGDENEEEDDGLASPAGDSGEHDDDDSLLMEVELDLSNEKEISNIGCAIDDRHTSFELLGFFHSTSYDEPSTSYDKPRTNPDLDWGLVKLANQSMCPPNNAKREQSAKYRDPLPTSDRDVILRSGISGYKEGVLSGENSFLMMRARGSFVKTRNLKLSDDTVLQPGDCGSWVVDRQNNKILGHVVASDDFGEAYVVPMWDVLNDISINCGADEVRPALELDILVYGPQQEQSGITPSAKPFQADQPNAKVESHLSDHWPSRESLNNPLRWPGSSSSPYHFGTPQPFLLTFSLPPIFNKEVDLGLAGESVPNTTMAKGNTSPERDGSGNVSSGPSLGKFPYKIEKTFQDTQKNSYPQVEPHLSFHQPRIDQKFLGQFAKNTSNDNALLSSMLFKVLGLSVALSKQLVQARKLRKLDPTGATKSLNLYLHIIWLAREGLDIVEKNVLPIVDPFDVQTTPSFSELKVLSYKLRASFYHIFVLFHNDPSVSFPKVVTTPPGLASPLTTRVDQGKAPDRGSPPRDSSRNSIQPSHPLEGSLFGVEHKSPEASFLLPVCDYVPTALSAFEEASMLAERLLWGSHPLRLSVKLEFSAFLYDCMHDGDASRKLAKATIAEVYNAQEPMDDDMFEDAAELVGVLGRMMKRGLGTPGSTPGMGSSGSKSTPRVSGNVANGPVVPSPEMDNPK